MNVHGQWVLPWVAATAATPTAAATPSAALPMQTMPMSTMLANQQHLINKMLLANGSVSVTSAAGMQAQQNTNSYSYVQQHHHHHQQQQQQQQHQQHQQHHQQHQQHQQQQPTPQQQQYMNLAGLAVHPSMLTAAASNPAYFGLSALSHQQPHQNMAAAAAVAAAAQIQNTNNLFASHQAMQVASAKSPLLRTPTIFTSKDAACSQLLASSSVPTSSSIHCSTPEANIIRGSSVTNNSLEGATVASTVVNSSSLASSLTSTMATKRKLQDDSDAKADVKKAKLETKALKAKRPGFTDERYNETSYYHDCNLRKVYPYYFTFTTFTKGRWVGERILDVFAREFRAHPAEEYERCIKAGTLTVNYEKVDIDYRLKHNDLLANIVHRHEVPVSSEEIKIVHIDEDLVVVNKPASIPVHPCGRYRHNTVVFILAKEHGLKNLRTIHRLDRLTSGLLLFGRNPKKAREMEQQIRTRQVQKEYVCRVEGEFPPEPITCKEPIEVVSYKIGVCKVSSSGKDCHTDFQRLSFNGKTSVVLCKPRTGRMHQIRVHLQYLGYPVVNDPLYNHEVFGPQKGKGGLIGKSDEQLIQDLLSIHNAENWLGMDDDLPGGGGPGPAGLGPAPMAVQPSVSPKDKKVPRSDTPDSAVTDLHSIPTSTDSPSSNSPASCNGDLLDNVGTSIHKTSTGSRNGNGIKNNDQEKVTIATQTGIEEADKGFDIAKLSVDPHCYECKVKYRDPRPKDLVMFLHAWTYAGPDWHYRTELPNWAKENWVDEDQEIY